MAFNIDQCDFELTLVSIKTRVYNFICHCYSGLLNGFEATDFKVLNLVLAKFKCCILLTNTIFYFFVYSWGILIFTKNSFTKNMIVKNINYGFIKQ